MLTYIDCISGVIVSMFTSSVVDHRVKPLSGQTKDYKIGICCFSVKHAVLYSGVRARTGFLTMTSQKQNNNDNALFQTKFALIISHCKV